MTSTPSRSAAVRSSSSATSRARAIKFERNPNYYEEGKPYFDAMEYRIISDITALTNAVMSGEVNFSNEIPPKDWATVQSNPDLVGKTLEGSRYYWLLPNNTKPPLDNPKVRQAIAHAIDRQAIVAGAFFGQATPILGGVDPGMELGLCRHQLLHAAAATPARPRQLLAEAGHPDGFETSMTMASSFPAMVAMAPIIQANLAAVGIKATIGTMEIPRYWDEVWGTEQLRHHHHVLAVSPLADPDDFVTNNYKCGMAINVQKSCSEAMDAILERGQGGADPGGAQGSSIKQMQELSLEEMGIVPLVNAWILIAHTKKLQELQADAHRLPEDAEGRLVRIAVDAVVGRGRSDRTPAGAIEVSRMLRLIAFRLLAFVPTLLAASLVLFIAINVVPGSAAKAALGIDATPQAIARFEAQHGLDRPLHVQYLEWLGRRAARRFRQVASRTACRSGPSCSRACR